MTLLRHAAALALFALSAASTAPVAADVVLEWNRIARDVLRENPSLQNPGMASRSMAMMNLAMYDALAMTSPGGTMFYDYGGGHASPNYQVSRDAAAIQAAYTVLTHIYDDRYSFLTEDLEASLALLPDSVAKTEGIQLGAMIGQTVFDSRVGDGFNNRDPYTPTNEPGHWQPDPLHPYQEAWGPNWGSVKPFMLPSGREYLPPPPPEMTSQEYADAFDEVKRLGSVDSTERTADQTEIGLFWAYDRGGMGTPIRLYNKVLDTIAVQQGNTVDENAKLFTKASVAMADAGVVAWNSKFDYDFWRPVTGIREADADGNPLTEADPDWAPLGAPGDELITNFTPPFPTYVSGHSSFGGALFGALQEFYGTDDISFVLESEEIPGAIREYDSFSQAMAENGRSRIYLGIHWSFDDTFAQQLGQNVASHMFAQPFVSPIPEPTGLGIALAGLTGILARRRSFRFSASHDGGQEDVPPAASQHSTL